jgi:hypothetical protein
MDERKQVHARMSHVPVGWQSKTQRGGPCGEGQEGSGRGDVCVIRILSVGAKGLMMAE